MFRQANTERRSKRHLGQGDKQRPDRQGYGVDEKEPQERGPQTLRDDLVAKLQGGDGPGWIMRNASCVAYQ